MHANGRHAAQQALARIQRALVRVHGVAPGGQRGGQVRQLRAGQRS